MILKKLDFERLFIVLIIIVGISIRVAVLGRAALSDYEAENALQALKIVTRADPGNIANPGFVQLTSILFFLFEDNNFLARFIPALAGCVLFLTVIGFRKLFGRTTALILMLGLAFDPGLVAASRLASHEMISLASGVLFLTGIYLRRPVLTGVAGAIALLSGPSVYGGALGIALATCAGIYLKKSSRIGTFWDDHSREIDRPFWGAMLSSGVLTLILAGTLFFSLPSGITAIFNGLSVYMAGWLKSAGVPAGRLLFALLVYQPLPVILAIIGSVEGWRERKPVLQWLSLWATTSVIVAFLYPSRQVTDLIWALIPLWGLAAAGLTRFLNLDEVEFLPAIGQAALIVLLASLSWFNMAGLSIYQADYQTYQLRWVLIFGTFLLGAVATILVGFGWSFKAARQGLIWGLVCAFGLYSLSNLWEVTGFNSKSENEVWHPQPVVRQAAQLITTLSDLSQWRTGIENSLDVMVLVHQPSIRWILRDWPSARFLTAIPSGELPSTIITSDDHGPLELAIGYRGQDFTWEVSPDWIGSLPPNWPEWLVFRKTPQRVERVILWVRSDVFPGGEIQSGMVPMQPENDILIPKPSGDLND